MKDYCGAILQHEILELVVGEKIRVRFDAVDPELVRRSDQFKVVAGWYTWLCLDMVCCMLIGKSKLDSLTEKFDLNLIRTYRYPTVLSEAWIEDIVDDRWHLGCKLFLSNGNTLADAKVKLKVFDLGEKND